MAEREIPQSLWMVHCQEEGDLVPARCGYAGSNQIACGLDPCPIYEYHLVREDEATVEAMRPFPMQDGPPIPWGVAKAIYEHLYRYNGQSLERLAQRGGFGWAEVQTLWRDRRRTHAYHRDACVAQARAALTAARGDKER